MRTRRARRRNEHKQLLLSFVQQSVRLSFRQRRYWLEAARREGYATIKEAIVGIYRETGSMEATAQRLTFTRQCISRKLRQLGEPVKGPGGANNPYGRAGKPGREV